MEYPVCRYCGSKDLISDATAYWDHNLREWVLNDVMGSNYCNTCDTEGKYCNWEEYEEDNATTDTTLPNV